MSTPQMVQSYWRKLVESWQHAAKNRMLPEYSDDQERNHNHRYYR